jgi:NADPH:quinone reductase-like Zn-dependent oxidoreductase
MLGVAPDAGPDEIKRAYRRLARELHPDVNPDAGAQERFAEVSAAYEVLSDPEKRRVVDLGGDPLGNGGQAGAGGDPFSAFGFGDIMDAFFGGSGGMGGRGRGPRSRVQPGADALIRMSLTLEECATGVTRDGGYATHMLALASALAHVPEALDSVKSAPLLCAGITTFNALRNCGAKPGDLVAIHGVGGLGHLAIQFAARQGFRTVAVNRGRDKEALARSLGAHDYIDSEVGDPAHALQAMGGAKAIIATVTSAEAMQAISGGLGVNGTMMVIGAVGALTVNSLDLLGKRASVRGWYSGTAVDSEDTLLFSQLNEIASMNEILPLEEAQAAYDRMMSGKARFRVVLKIDS